MSKVLILEDDPDLSAPVQLKLEKEGFEVKIAENGRKGWEVLQGDKIDCVILDLVMPETDGVWFLEKLRNSPNLTNIPVIVFTNLSEGEKVAKVVALGAYRLLVKADTSMRVLVNTVKEVIRIYQTNQNNQ